MMIKKELSLLILILIIIPAISGLDIKLSKDSYQPSETLQAEINGNFISLKSENIMIYKDHKVHSEPVINGFTNQNHVYHFYALLPNQEGNYSLRVENSEYIQYGEIKKDRIIKNFTIIKTNQSSLSLNPGLVFTNKDFSIKIKALNENQNIPISFENYSTNLNIREESEEEVKFSIAGIPTKNSIIKIGNYVIPAFIINNIVENNSGLISQIYFSADSINAVVFPNKTYVFNFYLENTGQTNLTNITLTNNLNAFINPERFDILNIQEKKQVNFTIFIPNDKKNITGKITARFQNKSESLPIFLEITENKSKALTPVNTSGSLSCTKIGKICLSDEECKGQLTPSLEGVCCIGTCDKKTTSSSNWIYGVAALILVVIIAAIILIKYKQKQNKRPKSIDEMMREKVDLKKLNKRKLDEEDI